MTKAKRAPARRRRATKIARGKGASVRQNSRRQANPPKSTGGPAPGTPSPIRTRMTPELQTHVRRLYEETDQPVCQIALDVDVNESVIRRMGRREGWVRYVAPPRDLPPVAKLLAQVEELEREPDPPSFEGGLRPLPQDDGGSHGGTRDDNIARFTQVVMAHLDEFEAMRRDGKLLPKHHLATARAISILTEAFNRLARLRAALPGTIHDDLAANDMPADLDAFREELAQRIEKFIASRTDPGAFADVAGAPAERADE